MYQIIVESNISLLVQISLVYSAGGFILQIKVVELYIGYAYKVCIG